MPGPVAAVEITKKKKAVKHNTTDKRQWSSLRALQVKTGSSENRPPAGQCLGPPRCPDAECEEVQEEESSMQEMLGGGISVMSWSHFMRSLGFH